MSAVERPHVSVAAAGFGSVIGYLIGLLLAPLLSILPDMPTVKNFIEGLGNQVLIYLLAVGFALAASLSGRIDLFISKDSSKVSQTAALLTPVAIWLNAQPKLTVLTVSAVLVAGGMLYAYLRVCFQSIIEGSRTLTKNERA